MELRHPRGAHSQAAASPHRMESTEVIGASDQNFPTADNILSVVFYSFLKLNTTQQKHCVGLSVNGDLCTQEMLLWS